MYHGKARPDTIHPRLETFQRGERQPIKGAKNEDAFGNMDAAVAVFGPGKDKDGKETLGDKIIAPKEFLDFLGVKEGARWTEDLLKKILIRTGSVETGFSLEQKKQRGGGPGRSYWQVEPETALSLLRDSKDLFGSKFEKRFSKYKKSGMTAREFLASLEGAGEMSEILLKDGDLAATLAMAKWNAALQNLVKENAERIMAEAQALEQGLG
jgi:hypothetical protein